MTEVIFKYRRDTPEGWTSKNPILALGEPGLELDATFNTRRLKFGDGFTRWNDLDYFVDVQSIAAALDAVLPDAIEDAIGDIGTGVDSRIGDLAELTTSIKDTIVNSINEVNTPPVPFALLYENAKAG